MAQAIIFYFMVIELRSVRDLQGIMYIYVEINTMEMVGYQADGTQSQLSKIAVVLHI